MSIRRVGKVLLKVLTCTVGGAIAGVVCMLVVYGDAAVLAVVIIGASIGLLVGISWAIPRREVRTAFVVPSVLGLIVALVTILAVLALPELEVFFNSGLGFRLFYVLIMAFPVGLFIRIVWSLSRAGVFGNK
jgi:hypothetical protein